jgi:hypothetical protein
VCAPLTTGGQQSATIDHSCGAPKLSTPQEVHFLRLGARCFGNFDVTAGGLCDHACARAWGPVKPNTLYPIVVNNFDAAGGDSNFPLAAGKVILSNGKPLDVVLTNYFKTFSPASAPLNVMTVKVSLLCCQSSMNDIHNSVQDLI